MSGSFWTTIGVGIVGIILLLIEYRTKWFARSLTSSNKKQSRIKSSPKQPPLEKPDVANGHRNPFTYISGFLQKKEWLGAGVLVGIILIILGIIQIIFPGGFSNRIISPPPSNIKENPQQTVQQSEKPATEYREHPSPIEIKNQILGEPLLQQENAANSFIGLRVQWQLELFSVSKNNSDPNLITIDLVEESYTYPDVLCNIDIREYPEIKIAKKGNGVFVQGEISRLTPYTIELINCTVRFD